MHITRLTRLALAVCLPLAMASTVGCQDIFECVHQPGKAVLSPDGKLKAALVEVACGATTANTTWVVLTDAAGKFDDERDEVAVFEGRVHQVSWEGCDLIVVYGDAKQIKASTSAKGVRIEYRRQ